MEDKYNSLTVSEAKRYALIGLESVSTFFRVKDENVSLGIQLANINIELRNAETERDGALKLVGDLESQLASIKSHVKQHRSASFGFYNSVFATNNSTSVSMDPPNPSQPIDSNLDLSDPIPSGSGLQNLESKFNPSLVTNETQRNNPRILRKRAFSTAKSVRNESTGFEYDTESSVKLTAKSKRAKPLNLIKGEDYVVDNEYWNCLQCTRVYESLASLNKHYRQKHLNAKK